MFGRGELEEKGEDEGEAASDWTERAVRLLSDVVVMFGSERRVR